MKKLLVTLSIAAMAFTGMYGDASALIDNGVSSSNSNSYGTRGNTGLGSAYSNNGYTSNGVGTNDGNYTRMRNNTGNYTTRATTTGNNNMDWGWLGLLGLIGLAGMTGRNKDRSPMK